MIKLKPFYPPAVFVLVIWAVKIFEVISGIRLVFLGVMPRAAYDSLLEGLSGLRGVLTAPLIHSGYEHLFSNSAPLLVLGGLLFWFFRKQAFTVFIVSYLLPGVITWLIGRPAFHIGASGIVYSLAFFVFFAGVFTRHRGLMALSLITVFLYGSIVWGILPLQEGVSWEGHLGGAITGVLLALVFKHSIKEGFKVNERGIDDGPVDDNWDYRKQTEQKHFTPGGDK